MSDMLHTSQAWMEILSDAPQEVILDPDGWDRKNYQYSFHEELISYSEFQTRLSKSTIVKADNKLLNILYGNSRT